MNREPNNGRGPVDFKVSSGAHDKALIEFKLAKSSSLKRNLQKQVDIYLTANKTPNAVKVVIAYSQAEMDKVGLVLSELGLAKDVHGHAIPQGLPSRNSPGSGAAAVSVANR